MRQFLLALNRIVKFVDLKTFCNLLIESVLSEFCQYMEILYCQQQYQHEGTRLGYWCLSCIYVCVSFCLMSTPCTFNSWQKWFFHLFEIQWKCASGSHFYLLLSYFWVCNCSKCICGSIPVSDGLQEMRGCCKLKEEALDHTV